MAADRLGLFVMVDGLDGAGKGVILDGLRDYVMYVLKKNVFELEKHWLNHGDHPELSDMIATDAILSSEPTSVGIGKAIRDELISDSHNRKYPAAAVAQAYSLDRLILYSRVSLPALRVGKWIFQSRGVPTSLVYQPIQSDMMQGVKLPVDYLLNLEGNKLALENSPDLLIIPTVKDVAALAKRLAMRSKKDHAIFETTPFQERVKAVYESQWFRELFEKRGTVVKYLDAGVSVEHSRSEAVRILGEFLKSRGIAK